MQRVYYAANPNPDSFWSLTFDEVLLVIQGQVDRWRIERRNAHRIHETFLGSDKALSVEQFNPLPYDDEMSPAETGMSDAEIYDLVKRLNNNFDVPITVSNG